MKNLYLKESDCIGHPRFYKLYQKMFKKSKESDRCVAFALMREYSKWAKMQAIYQNCIDLQIKVPQEVGDYIDQNPFGPKDEADLMFIYTHEDSKGYGMELLEHLKRVFKIIRTSYDGSTKAGRKLCIKAGFKKMGDIIIWERRERNGVNQSERSAEEGDGKETQGQA